MEPRKEIMTNNNSSKPNQEKSINLFSLLPPEVKEQIVEDIVLNNEFAFKDLAFFARASKTTQDMCADTLKKGSEWKDKIINVMASFMAKTSKLLPTSRFDGTSISRLKINDLESYHDNLKVFLEKEERFLEEKLEVIQPISQSNQVRQKKFDWTMFPLHDFFNGWKNANDPYLSAKASIKGNNQTVESNHQVKETLNSNNNVNNNTQASSNLSPKIQLLPINIALLKGYDRQVHQYILHNYLNVAKNMNQYLEHAIFGGNAECIQIILTYMNQNKIKLTYDASYYLNLLLKEKSVGVIATTKQACFNVMAQFLDVTSILQYEHLIQTATYEQNLRSRFSDGITQTIYNKLLTKAKSASKEIFVDESFTNNIQALQLLTSLIAYAQQRQSHALLEFLVIQKHEGQLESEKMIQTLLTNTFKMKKEIINDNNNNNHTNDKITPTLNGPKK